MKNPAYHLQPPPGALWRWSENADAVTWTDGTTIVLTEELESVLRRLAPQGLPPLGAVVLLLAACRENWPMQSFELSLLQQLGDLGHLVPQELLQSVLHLLDRVAAFPDDIWKGEEAKGVLAEVVFERTDDRTTPEEACAVLLRLHAREVPNAPEEPDSSHLLYQTLRAFRVLEQGLAGLDPDALRMRRRTGLSTRLLETVLKPPDAGGIRLLIEALERDREHAGIGRLARKLMAATHIPRSLLAFEDLPVGGVTDITNRGPLDRLLISELANDDLVLAVRVALHEALYYRRESPPRVPPPLRAILIDTGIRMWGVPRLFAAAAGLALAATSGPRTRVLLLRARGKAVEPVDTSTIEGFTRHLEILETSIHPGPAVQAFLAAFRASGACTEAIVVTHADTLLDPAFQAALGDATLHVATVERDGRFVLFERTPRGKRKAREARIDIEGLCGPEIGTRAAEPALPAALLCDPFPLLLPHPVSSRNVRWSEGFGLFAVTDDGRLLHRARPDRGALEITAILPPGKVYWLQTDDVPGIFRAVIGAPPRHPLRMVEADISGRRTAVHELPGGEVPTVACHARGGVLFLIRKTGVDAYWLATFERAGHLSLPDGLKWQYGRFFHGLAGWYALHHDGFTCELEAIHPRGKRTPGSSWVLFDRNGVDGPWAVTPAGRIVSLVDGTSVPRHGLQPPVAVLSISQDGHRIVLRGIWRGETTLALVDLENETVRRLGAESSHMVEPEIQRFDKKMPSLRVDFRGIFVDGSGDLALVSADDEVWRMRLEAPNQIQLVRDGAYLLKQQPRVSWFRNFRPTRGPDGTRYGLKLARWSTGARAYLDDRGLLHLISGTPGEREMALVLGKHLAGWSSDGRMFGSRFFVGDGPRVEAELFHADIRRFAAELQ